MIAPGKKNVFEKFRFQNVFLPHKNEKPMILNSSGLKSVFEAAHADVLRLVTRSSSRKA